MILFTWHAQNRQIHRDSKQISGYLGLGRGFKVSFRVLKMFQDWGDHCRTLVLVVQLHNSKHTKTRGIVHFNMCELYGKCMHYVSIKLLYTWKRTFVSQKCTTISYSSVKTKATRWDQGCCCLVTKSYLFSAILCQATLSMRFSRQESWSGLPFPSSGDLPNPRINCVSYGFFTFEPRGKPKIMVGNW